MTFRYLMIALEFKIWKPSHFDFEFKKIINLSSICDFLTKHQTCTRPEYHICYFDLLSFDDFFVDEKYSGLPSKIKVADEKKLVQRGNLSFTYLGRQRAEFLFSKKIRQMKAGRNNKHSNTKTLLRSSAGLQSIMVNIISTP